MRGDMTLQEFGLYNWRGGGGSIFFAPVSQAMGSETTKQVDLAKRILGKHGFDFGRIHRWLARHAHVIDLLYDKTDPDRPSRHSSATTNCLPSS
jgi:4-cresol dehydrogenase (hydroxylating)